MSTQDTLCGYPRLLIGNIALPFDRRPKWRAQIAADHIYDRLSVIDIVPSQLPQRILGVTPKAGQLSHVWVDHRFHDR